MINLFSEKCIGCRICEKNCPIGAINVVDKKAIINESCVSCKICVRVCPKNALEYILKEAVGATTCTNCPVRCSIPLNSKGACKRFTNIDGIIVRNRQLVVEGVTKQPETDDLPYNPLITAVGGGSRYPCCLPAPYIVQECVDGVDVVTVVTEAPLSYSGVKVKIDSNVHIGEEGAKVRRDGKIVGMVTTEEYGSKMLTIGGANLLSHGNDGFIVARTIVDLANGREVSLKVDKGSRLTIQQGKAPVIDGKEERLMRVGCGSATIGMFAKELSKVVDEAIILDYHIIGLLSEHLAGKAVGIDYSGVVPYGTKSTVGRYFGRQGAGWGGTEIEDPLQAIVSTDKKITKIGARILVTETTGQKAALFEVQADHSIAPVEMTAEVREVVDLIKNTCEPSMTSVIYTGGTGGSARAGVTRFPKRLTDAVHARRVKLTIGGAPTYILPGGGINFMVDVAAMVPQATSWVPTPATVAPIEYTMKRKVYEELGGHIAHIRSKQEVLQEIGL